MEGLYMNYRKDKKKIIRELLHESDKELTDDELIAKLLETGVTINSEKARRSTRIRSYC